MNRENITSVTELIGASLVTAGISVIFGVGVALIFAGIALMTFSWLAAK